MTERARVYGTVLFELDIPRETAEQAGALLRDHPQLKKVLTSPVVKNAQKQAILKRIFREPDFSPLMLRFLMKAAEAGCIGQMEDILKVCEELRLKSRGIVKAKLRYVTMPEESWIEKIRGWLCQKYGYRDVQFVLVKDPSLIGGFILSAGDMEYDCSLRAKLRELRKTVVR